MRFALGTAVAGALGYLGGRASADGAFDAKDHQRGAMVSTTTRSEPVPAENSRDRQISFAGSRIPIADETKHFKLIGTTGTGKSTAIQEILSVALGRGDRAVIADPDGGYAKRFYDARPRRRAAQSLRRPLREVGLVRRDQEFLRRRSTGAIAHSRSGRATRSGAATHARSSAR